MTRKNFIHRALVGFSTLAAVPSLLRAQAGPAVPPLDPELVKEFVGAGHNNLDRVRELLAEQPNLIYSRHDWGNGDFEEAIEGAGHVGNREIAEFLISQGARVNLFVLTMLGQTELVKPVLEQYPALIFAKGAHGFTLLHHAQRGGAEDLMAYLEEKGLRETQIKLK